MIFLLDFVNIPTMCRILCVSFYILGMCILFCQISLAGSSLNLIADHAPITNQSVITTDMGYHQWFRFNSLLVVYQTYVTRYIVKYKPE